MSVVAGFVADPQGCANPGQGAVSAGAQIEAQGRSGGTAARGSSPVQDGTENVRSSWQEHFASLFLQGADTPVATATKAGDSGTEPATQETAVTTDLPAASISPADAALRWRLAAGQGNDSTRSTASAQVAPENNLAALGIPVSVGQQIVADGAAKTSESTQPFLSTKARDSGTGKSSKREADSDGPVSVAAHVSQGNDPLSQILPQAATWVMAANAAGSAPPQALPDSLAVPATGAASGSLGEASVVSPRSGAGSGSAYAPASGATSTAGYSTLSSIAIPNVAEHSSSLADSAMLPGNSGASGSANSLKAESSASSLNGGQAAIAVSSDSVQAHAEGTVDSMQPPVALQAESHFGDSASASPSASLAGSDAGLNLANEAPALSSGSAAARSTLAFPNAGSRSGTTPPLVHAAILPATGETETPGGSRQGAEADNSEQTKSSAVTSPVSLSVQAQAQAVDAQQPSVQRQSPLQTQLASQTIEPATAAASSNESNRATEPEETALVRASATLTKARKPAAAAAANASEPVAARSTSSAIAAETGGHGLAVVQPHTGAIVSDVSSLSRDPSVARDALSAAGGTTASGTNSAGGSAATFAALDSTSGSAASSWTHAGARHAEAGFQDPSLGWVGVRADLNAGGVHATVIPGSTDAAQALGGHMAGLNAYLSDEHAHVETLTLAVPESRDAGVSTGQNSGQGTNQNANQDTGQGSGQNNFSESPANTQAMMPATLSPREEQGSVLSGTLGNGMSGASQQGGHISVMA
jgi:hypothetical protein